MSHDPFTDAPPPAPVAAPPPWGLLGTIAWGAAGVIVWFLAQFVIVIVFIAWRDVAAPGSVDPGKLAHDGFLLAFITVLAGPAWAGVSALAARIRGWTVRGYLA